MSTPEEDVEAVRAWLESWQVSERDESLETGIHHTGVDGNVITMLSERKDGSYFFDCVVVDTEEERGGRG